MAQGHLTFDKRIPERLRVRVPAAASAIESDPVEFARKRLRFEPDARQAEVLRMTSKRVILNCSRQWGKSTVAAVKALHRVLAKPGSLVLVASPTDRQSGEFLNKTEELVRTLGIAVRGDGYNARSLLMPNGSRIVGLPGTEGTGRGFSSVSMVLIDEAAVVDDSLYKMLRPTLMRSDGDLWLMSTPRGKRGFFYNAWAHGGKDWDRVSVRATECAWIDPAQLEESRRQEGLAWFRQEYMCEFVDGVSGTFDRDVVEGAFDAKVPRLNLSRLSTWE